MIGGWGVGLSADLHQLWGDPDLPFNFVSYDNPQVQAIREEVAELEARYQQIRQDAEGGSEAE